jgi:transcriptional regulator with XRE-family HTH domain
MAGTDERSTLARNVKALRLQRGLSQEELAAAAGGLRQAAISEIEAAKGNPTFTTLEFVAAALGVSIRDLLKPARDR